MVFEYTYMLKCLIKKIYTEKKKIYTVHKLVAKIFLNNPGNRQRVIHKDGGKMNNHVANLEWYSKSAP